MKTSPLRKGDLVYLSASIKEVVSVSCLADGRFDVRVHLEHHERSSEDTHTLTLAQAHEALIARDEDMYSTTTLDLRYKESMLMSQMVLLGLASQQTTEWRKAMMELERTLYAVQFVLENRGARKVGNERLLSV